MNRKYVFLLTLLTIFVPNIIKASINSTYDESIVKANEYILPFKKKDAYLIFGRDLKYNLESADSMKTDSDFYNGAFLSKFEYEISKQNHQTYLSTGINYWTLTPNKENLSEQYYINRNNVENISRLSNISSRVTEFIKEDIGVLGTGTYNDPWVFVEKFEVKFTGNDKVAIEKPKQYVTIGDKAQTAVTFTNGYAYGSDNCDGEYNNGIFTVSEVKKDFECKIVTDRKTINVSYYNEYDSSCNSTQTIKYLDKYEKINNNQGLCIPNERPGYEFAGWYTDKTAGEKITNNTVAGYNDITLYARWNNLQYTINYNFNSGKAGTYAPTTAKYGEIVTISNPTRSSCYSFSGWKITGISSEAKAGSKDTNITYDVNVRRERNTKFLNLANPGETVTFEATWSYSCGSSSSGSSSSGSSSSGSSSSSSTSSCSTICEMQKNSEAWHDCTTQSCRDDLHSKNEELSKNLNQDTSFNKNEGKWYDENGKQLYTTSHG